MFAHANTHKCSRVHVQVAYGLFGGNQLSGRASVLPNLTLLDLGHNNYTEVSFAEMPSSLQRLYLGNNGLSGSMPPLLGPPSQPHLS